MEEGFEVSGNKRKRWSKGYGSEGKPILQQRKENNQERKLNHGKLYKEGGDAHTKRNKISIVSWTRKINRRSLQNVLMFVYIDTFPIPLAIKHGRKCLELVLIYRLLVWLVQPKSPLAEILSVLKGVLNCHLLGEASPPFYTH